MDASELVRRRQARTVFRGMVEKQQYYESENISKGIGVNVGTKMSGSGKYPEWVYLVQQGNLFTTPEELPGATVQTVSAPTVSAPTVAPPAAPTITTISGANTVLTVYFTAPTSDGGLPITDYEVSTDNGLTFQLAGSTSSPLTINSLTNGTVYQVVIRAVNAAGSGTASSAVSGTPVTTPLAPTITGIISGNTTLSVAFTAPVSNGGSAITDYEVSTNNGVSYISAGTTTSPILLTGLANGTTYQVVIRAVNAVPGSGVASNVASGTPATTPSAPTITSVTAGNTTLSVAFTAPTTNGGSAITGYEVSTNNGSTYSLAGSMLSPLTITGLTNGTTYQVVIRAVNSVGSGTVSTAVSGTPAAPPSGPTGAVGQAQWATYLGFGNSAINSRSVITDSQGNVYITGSYNYTASSIIVQDVNGTTQTPSSILLPASGSGGAMFIVKYNQSGQAQWATCIDGLSGTTGTSSGPDSGLSVNVDSQDNIYISGYYTATYSITIKDASGTSQSNSAITLSTRTTQAVCLIKYNSSGIAQWATYFDGTGTIDQSNGLYIDSYDNIYSIGQYSSSPTSVPLQNASGITQSASLYSLPISVGNDTFVVKYDANGQVLWGTVITSTGSDYGYYITGDSSGNIYITGQTRSPTIKDVNGFTQTNSSVTLQTMTNNSMYLVCYNSSGIAQWATYLNPSNGASGYGISLDSQNNIYVTGIYTHAQITSSTVVLKDASGTGQSDSLVTLPHTTLNGTNKQSIFLIKYNSSGKVQWAVGIIADGLSFSGNVICDNTDNIYICGRYGSTSQVYLPNVSGNTQSSSSIVLPAPGANSDAYLIKYNSFGQAQWGLNIGGQGLDVGNGLTIDMNGSIYITGAYGSTNTTVIINNANGNGQTTSSVSMPAQTLSSGYGYLIKYS